MTKTSNFKPFTLFKNPHLQTFAAYYLSRTKPLASKTTFIQLADQDVVTMEESTPDNWKNNDPIVLMLHGMGGSHASSYMVRLTHKFLKKGMKVMRLNHRGVGLGVGLSRKISHGGSSDDLLQVIEFITNKYPDSPISAIGFSLSGNILLKLSGEVSLTRHLRKVIAVCPPVNLAMSSKMLEKKSNRLYLKSFIKSLSHIVESSGNIFEHQSSKPLKRCSSLRDFDNAFTAPAAGYTNADSYYKSCSSLNVLQNIEVSCHLLLAQDDPFVDSSEIQKLSLPENIELCITSYGGHMGYISSSIKQPFWMDEKLLHWID